MGTRRGSYFAQERSGSINASFPAEMLPNRILCIASLFSITTGCHTNTTICATRGSARLSTSVVILRETFVHLVPFATGRVH